MSYSRVRGIAALAFMLGSMSLMQGCDDDETAPDAEPAIQSMRLTVGTQSVTIDDEGNCTGCPLALSNNAEIRAEFLGANGEPDPVAVEGTEIGSRYRLQVTVPNNNVGLVFNFSTTQSFRGTFVATGTTATPMDLSFRLRDTQENETEFGPFDVAVTVVTP